MTCADADVNTQTDESEPTPVTTALATVWPSAVRWVCWVRSVRCSSV